MSTSEFTPGTRIRGRSRTITESDLVSFAAITGDWHPQHVDADWASRSDFGERIAHGMLVLSYSVGLLGFDPEQVIALRGIDSLTFKRPVAIGETVRPEAEVEEVRQIDPEHELVVLRWRVLGGDGRAALRARFTILCRPGGSLPAPSTGSDDLTSHAPTGSHSDALYGEQVLL